MNSYVKKLWIPFILIFLVLGSCSRKREELAPPVQGNYPDYKILERRIKLSQHVFCPEEAENDLSRPATEYSFPFTVNYSWYGSPVIKIELNGKELLMVVDTGTTRSFLFLEGITKLYESEEDFFLKNGTYWWYKANHIDNNPEMKDLSREQIMDKLREKLRDGSVYTWVNLSENNRSGKYYYYATRSNPVNGQVVDGILGSEFLLQFKTVTFDFNKNYLYMNKPALEGSVIPLIKNKNDIFYIHFMYKRKEELGLLDTGNFTFCPRQNIGDDSPDFDINSDLFGMFAGKTVDQVLPSVLTLRDIKIGDILYKNIRGEYSFVTDTGFNYGAQTQHYYISNLGTEFFFDHVIQFDYENMKFIIQ